MTTIATYKVQETPISSYVLEQRYSELTGATTWICIIKAGEREIERKVYQRLPKGLREFFGA